MSITPEEIKSDALINYSGISPKLRNWKKGIANSLFPIANGNNQV